MNSTISGIPQKALAINRDPLSYGTVAEMLPSWRPRRYREIAIVPARDPSAYADIPRLRSAPQSQLTTDGLNRLSMTAA